MGLQAAVLRLFGYGQVAQPTPAKSIQPVKVADNVIQFTEPGDKELAEFLDAPPTPSLPDEWDERFELGLNSGEIAKTKTNLSIGGLNELGEIADSRLLAFDTLRKATILDKKISPNFLIVLYKTTCEDSRDDLLAKILKELPEKDVESFAREASKHGDLRSFIESFIENNIQPSRFSLNLSEPDSFGELVLKLDHPLYISSVERAAVIAEILPHVEKTLATDLESFNCPFDGENKNIRNFNTPAALDYLQQCRERAKEQRTGLLTKRTKRT